MQMAGAVMLRDLEITIQKVIVICRLMKQWEIFYPVTGQKDDHRVLFIDAQVCRFHTTTNQQIYLSFLCL